MTKEEWLDHWLTQAPILPEEETDEILELFELT